MNKTEMVELIAKEADLSKADAARALDALLDGIVETVKNGDKVSIAGFGTFERRERAAREGRNPSTGESIKIKAAKVPAFKAGKNFKDTVNK